MAGMKMTYVMENAEMTRLCPFCDAEYVYRQRYQRGRLVCDVETNCPHIAGTTIVPTIDDPNGRRLFPSYLAEDTKELVKAVADELAKRYDAQNSDPVAESEANHD